MKDNKIVNIEDYKKISKVKASSYYGKQITNTNTYFDEFITDVDNVCENVDKNNELFNDLFGDYFKPKD